MKCKICGKRANSLAAMNKHYAKAHPGRKRKKKKVSEVQDSGGQTIVPPGVGAHFCKWCGGRID